MSVNSCGTSGLSILNRAILFTSSELEQNQDKIDLLMTRLGYFGHDAVGISIHLTLYYKKVVTAYITIWSASDGYQTASI